MASNAKNETRRGGDVVKVTHTAAETTSGEPIFAGSSDTVVVACFPDGGATMKAQATWSSEYDVRGGTARWFDWDHGMVAVPTMQLLTRATAVRFVTVGGGGYGEVSR